jgi:type IV pilus assembly protein PilF
MRKPLVFLALALCCGCPGDQHKADEAPTDDKTLENSRIHYDLGVNDQAAGNVRDALDEYQLSLTYNPANADAEDALGLLYHLSFRKLDLAEKHYLRALEIEPKRTSARVNLAALYLDEGRYDEAIALDEKALSDLEYKNGFLAANNEGWAYFKKGQPDRALLLIQQAVRAKPEFCQGYRNLGLIYQSQSKLDMAEVELSRLTKKCPDSAEGHHELGQVEASLRKPDAAKKEFCLCRDKSKEGEALLDTCTKLCGSSEP